MKEVLLLKPTFNISKFTITKMNWEQLLSGSAMGAIVAEAIRHFKAKLRKKHLPSQTLLKVNDIYAKCMKPVLDSTSIQRFLILKAENGGGKIAPGAQIYSSVLYEDYEPPLRSLVDKFQRWVLDKHYIEVLMKICTEGNFVTNTTDMPDESKLKTTYLADGITYGEMYFIAQSRDKLFYCMLVTTNSEHSVKEAASRVVIDLSINHLRNIFKESLRNL